MKQKEPIALGHQPTVVMYEEVCETVEYGDKDPSRQGFRKVADRRKAKPRKRGRK